MNQPRIAIIIPHYNSVDGIMRLLASIPDDDGIQVIIVDDRSTEAIDFVKKAASIRKNTSIISNDKPAKGAGAARNIGLEHAEGKWLLFADADDYFVENGINLALEYFNSDADIIYFSPTSFNKSTNQTGARHRHYEELVQAFAAKRSKRTENELRYGFYTPWSKLIRRTVFSDHDIYFDEVPVANDVMAMTKCAYYSKTVIADPRIIYCVTCGEQTLTSRKNKANFHTRINIKIERYFFLKERLSKKDFNQTHADYYMAGSLADAVLGKWGRGMFWEILKKYHNNHVKWLTVYMFEPEFLLHYILLDFKWRKEMNGK